MVKFRQSSFIQGTFLIHWRTVDQHKQKNWQIQMWMTLCIILVALCHRTTKGYQSSPTQLVNQQHKILLTHEKSGQSYEETMRFYLLNVSGLPRKGRQKSTSLNHSYQRQLSSPALLKKLLRTISGVSIKRTIFNYTNANWVNVISNKCRRFYCICLLVVAIIQF